jgi:putative tricarboxylic transport membrane protein
VVPAGTGGGADQMARLIQGIVVKHNLMKQPLVVVNKSGGAGAEGFLDVKGAKGDPHKIVVTLSNLFTTPLATGVPFNWRDMTPVSMMALDNFVLWVNAETPYKNAKDYLAAVKAAGPSKMKMGGTGSKQEDQILTVGIEKATGTKFIYIPFKGGGEVAVQLVGKHIDSTVNNPIEAVAQWRAGQLRALCVFDDKRMPYKAKITDTQSWGTCPPARKPACPPTTPCCAASSCRPGVTKEQTDFYVDAAQEGARNAGVEGLHGKGRLQPDLHGRRQAFTVAGKARTAAPRADEGSRLHRQVRSRRPRRGGGSAPPFSRIPEFAHRQETSHGSNSKARRASAGRAHLRGRSRGRAAGARLGSCCSAAASSARAGPATAPAPATSRSTSA